MRWRYGVREGASRYHRHFAAYEGLNRKGKAESYERSFRHSLSSYTFKFSFLELPQDLLSLP